MRALPRPGLILALIAAVMALPAAASGAFTAPAAPAAVAANSQTYQDSTGENPAAPDISTITVSNTDAGLISFRINVANRPTLTPDLLYIVWVDTDRNPATGDPDSLGADYVIFLFQGEIILLRWDGTQMNARPGDPPATSLIFSYQGGPTISISQAELGNTARFGFATRVFSGVVTDPVTGDIDFAAALTDDAPSGGTGFYQYEVRLTPPSLVVRSLRPTPKAPTAGRPFTLRLVAARSDTGAVVQNGRVTCVGRIGNVRLKAQVQRVLAGAATCTWNLPPGAKGKTFRGSVGITFEGLKAQQSYSSRVR